MIDSGAERQIPQSEISPAKIPFDAAISSQKDEREAHHQNEDMAFFNKQNGSFGIFDGAGGMDNGAESSKFCSNLIQSELKAISPATPESEVVERFKSIAAEVQQAFLENKKKFNLGGSTGVFGIIRQDESGLRQAIIANIGDSRAYLYRPNSENSLTKLTTDHNNVEYYLGKYGPGEVKKTQDVLDNATAPEDLDQDMFSLYKERNKITNYFGIDEPRLPFKSEIYTVNLQPNDILLLTTDGIHDNLATTEIAKILSDNQSESSAEISRKIIDESGKRSREGNFRSKKDDMTNLAIKINKSMETKPDTDSQPLSEKFIPKVGQKVIVQRSSGAIEPEGWSISHIKDDRISVQKKLENGDVVVKNLSFEALDRFNRRPKPEDISTAKNFSQLIFTINKLGGLQGSADFFSKNQLIEIIKKYRKGEVGSAAITRTAGLRDTVLRLSQKAA